MTTRRGQILVVDDEPMVGRIVERAIGKAHAISVSTSGRDAFRRLEAGERFDLILCDMMMPLMSGIDLYEKVRALWPDQAERMVFLSGGAFTPRAAAFLEGHPSLEKPFDLTAIEALIESRIASPPTPSP